MDHHVHHHVVSIEDKSWCFPLRFGVETRSLTAAAFSQRPEYIASRENF